MQQALQAKRENTLFNDIWLPSRLEDCTVAELIQEESKAATPRQLPDESQELFSLKQARYRDWLDQSWSDQGSNIDLGSHWSVVEPKRHRIMTAVGGVETEFDDQERVEQIEEARKAAYGSKVARRQRARLRKLNLEKQLHDQGQDAFESLRPPVQASASKLDLKQKLNMERSLIRQQAKRTVTFADPE